MVATATERNLHPALTNPNIPTDHERIFVVNEPPKAVYKLIREAEITPQALPSVIFQSKEYEPVYLAWQTERRGPLTELKDALTGFERYFLDLEDPNEIAKKIAQIGHKTMLEQIRSTQPQKPSPHELEQALKGESFTLPAIFELDILLRMIIAKLYAQTANNLTVRDRRRTTQAKIHNSSITYSIRPNGEMKITQEYSLPVLSAHPALEPPSQTNFDSLIDQETAQQTREILKPSYVRLSMFSNPTLSPSEVRKVYWTIEPYEFMNLLAQVGHPLIRALLTVIPHQFRDYTKL